MIVQNDSGVSCLAEGASVAIVAVGSNIDPGPCDLNWVLRQAHDRNKLVKGKRIPEFVPSERSIARKPIQFASGQFFRPSTATAEKLLVGDRKEQKQGRRLSITGNRPPSSVIHVRRYTKPCWLTSSGVNRKRKLIESKGLPCMKNWRFMTLTVDRELHPCPLGAYLHGSDHMRRFMDACRKHKIWKVSCKWAWKLEFHSDWQGFPHWHLFLGHRMKFTHKQLAQINQFWGMGRTEVQRIEGSRFGYGFKYAFKPVSMDCHDGDEESFERLAPDWFLDYVGSKTVSVKLEDGSSVESEKPTTFKRVRFWQTSKGFYTGKKGESRPPKAQKTWAVPMTVREVLHADSRTVQVIARTSCGKYKASMCAALDRTAEKLWNLIGFDIVMGAAVGLACFSYVIPTDRLTTDKKTKWQLQTLMTRNHLSLRQAVKLQQAGETLRTC